MADWKIIYSDAGENKAVKGNITKQDSVFVYIVDDEGKHLWISKKHIVSMREL